MRGPGETQLETDKRIILDKISRLKKELVEIDKQKSIQRKNRGKMVRVALVGYTNVGKSTLMNLLSKSEVFAENKLFATLDTTVRKVIVDNLPFLLSDTVGFIRKLPTELVESFKSTLDEVREADLLVHVVDVSHPSFEEQIDDFRKERDGNHMNSKDYALLAAETLDSKKAEDIIIFDIAEKSSIADYLILATGLNERSVGALIDEVEDRLAQEGLLVKSIEGKKESGWILMDYGDIIVNVLTAEKRDRYNIEKVWADCNTLSWEVKGNE